MKNLLGNPIKTEQGFTIQSVGNIDSLVGKKITTNEDFMVEVEIKLEKETEPIKVGTDKEVSFEDLLEQVKNNKSEPKNESINLKGQEIIIDDIIRTCGLYLYCRTKDNRFFAITPEDLEIFEEVNK